MLDRYYFAKLDILNANLSDLRFVYYPQLIKKRSWLVKVITRMTVLFCRGRLESYEQSCAVDSVTKQCAGLPGDCRMAMLGILGTALRSNCACKGTDFTQLYDCMGWQRILWFNPCVGKSTLSSTLYCSKDFLILHFFEGRMRFEFYYLLLNNIQHWPY